MTRPLPPGVFGHATFAYRDGERVARIRLDRWWDPTLELDYSRPSDDRYRPLVCIGINPSKADGEGDDNTIGKLYPFARREGANGIVMVNLHPAITKDPKELAKMLLPFGTDERHWGAVDGAMSENAVAIVAMWGKPPRALWSYRDRVARVKEIAGDVGVRLMCFGKNGDGSPTHPLYLPASTPLEVWWEPR